MMHPTNQAPAKPSSSSNLPSYLQNADQCTHCGYCLPVCPTYRVENHENQSPRGRVSTILLHGQGHVNEEALRETLSHCLQCHACHRACPAGVKPARLALSVKSRTPLPPPAMAAALHRITDNHALTSVTSKLLALQQKIGFQRLSSVLPESWQSWHALLPKRRPVPPLWRQGDANPKRRVALLTGCMGRLFQPAIGRSAHNLLLGMGFEVHLLTGFGCCGFPHREEGHRELLIRQAEKLLRAVDRAGEVEAVVCDSGSCAVTASVYGKSLEKVPHLAEKAAAFSAKSVELSQFLVREGLHLRWPMADPKMGILTFQGHCQSIHMLGIMQEAHQLLKTIPTEFRPIEEEELCCGAGGSYMLAHPERSRAIRRLKLQAIQKTGAQTVVGGNPGCLMNLEAGLAEVGLTIETRHVAEVLWSAFFNYRREDPP